MAFSADGPRDKGPATVFLEECEMMKHVWTVLLAACVVTLATGCKGGDDEKEAGNGDGTGQASTETPTSDSNGGVAKPLVGTSTEGPTAVPKVDGTVETPSAHKRLMAPIEKGDIEAVKAALAIHPEYIINQKNRQRQTALTSAIDLGRNDIALLLIEKHADPNLEGFCGLPPLHLAASYGMADVVEALLDAGAGINAIGVSDRETPLHVAIDNGELAIAEILIGRGANIEARNKAGLRPLHKAAATGRIQAVQWLLKQNAFPNARANDGSTPMSLATAGNAKQIVDALKAAGGTLEGVPAESEPPPEE